MFTLGIDVLFEVAQRDTYERWYVRAPPYGSGRLMAPLHMSRTAAAYVGGKIA